MPTITVVNGVVLIDGVPHPELALTTQKPSLATWIADNKKMITGAIGSLVNLAFLVVSTVPELSTRFPMAVKIGMAVIAASGFAVAHASKPDVPARPPDTITKQ